MNAYNRLLVAVMILGIMSAWNYEAAAGDAGGGEACVLQQPPAGSLSRAGAVGLHITNFSGVEGNVDVTMRVLQGGTLFWFRNHFDSVDLSSQGATACSLKTLMQSQILAGLGFDSSQKQICVTQKTLTETDGGRPIFIEPGHINTGRRSALADLLLFVSPIGASCDG